MFSSVVLVGRAGQLLTKSKIVHFFFLKKKIIDSSPVILARFFYFVIIWKCAYIFKNNSFQQLEGSILENQ